VSTVGIRYMVDDVRASVAFYTTHLGFTLVQDASPAFASVVRGPRPIHRPRGPSDQPRPAVTSASPNTPRIP
jgi:catechol 2,3-dioxygenase-like lactoylglutathione lyase family enzyme